MRQIKRASISVLSISALALAVSGCGKFEQKKDAEAGAILMVGLGCGGCHTIPGVNGASGLVGPSLEHLASRVYIAGVLRNTPDNLELWIRHPQSIVPGNVMPNIPMSDDTAKKVVAYLDTLK